MKKYKNVNYMFKSLEDEKKKHPIKNFFFTIQCKLELYLYDKPIDFFREIKWFIQRGRRGWADCDTWNFDNYISKIIQGGLLKLQKDQCGGYIDDLTEENWKEILNKIINSFHIANLISEGSYFYLPTYKNKLKDYLDAQENLKTCNFLLVMSYDDCKKYEEGLSLFIKYFHNLWD